VHCVVVGSGARTGEFGWNVKSDACLWGSMDVRIAGDEVVETEWPRNDPSKVLLLGI